ncbi:MAG: ABC transporter ATP-binding protein [Planctomycetes bacterium]|nr:ABC transporter ATP-binding protein [Planctomycetota bacterium]
MSAVLNIENARKAYAEVQALNGVSFNIEASQIVTLLGPNGAGKSTLIRSISTLDLLDEGAITVGEFNVADNPSKAREQFGYAGQDSALDKVLTGHEFMRFQAGLVHLHKKDIIARVDELLARFKLTDAAHRAIETYSGGMKRRLDLAASLMHNPKLLILDEPSSGLDYESRRELWKLLLELKREGTAILLATHDFEEAEVLSDKSVLMAKGNLCGFDSPSELCNDLGEWIIGVSLSPHPREGDREKLAQLFSDVPGKVMPENPQFAEYAMALPVNAIPESGGDWGDYLTQQAVAQGLKIHALAMRRPTLADAYLAATSEVNNEL